MDGALRPKSSGTRAKVSRVSVGASRPDSSALRARCGGKLRRMTHFLLGAERTCRWRQDSFVEGCLRAGLPPGWTPGQTPAHARRLSVWVGQPVAGRRVRLLRGHACRRCDALRHQRPSCRLGFRDLTEFLRALVRAPACTHCSADHAMRDEQPLALTEVCAAAPVPTWQ